MAEDGQKLDRNTVVLTSGGKTSRVIRVGDLIGESYRLKGLIGRGGMGYVFRAEHVVMAEDYALKMLAPDQINEVTWNRFQAEGKAIARLDHPNIVKIYNMGIDQGDCPYFVMDLLDGVALADCISDQMPLSVDEILDMFIQMASGIGYAHSRGIIHRDVKPSNVMLVDSGAKYPMVKIVDFGIAKVASTKDLDSQSLTATGEIFGSPYYMSPEQCLGSEIDHRADIYSLGCTLFEALCGHPPFVGQSAMQTVLMHQNMPSPTLESAGSKFSSDEMEALVAKMLMKRPADRYQSMEQVRHDLERIRQNKAVGKNVETGFRSSVETQLEEIGSRYEEEQKNKIRQRRILIAFTVLVVGFVAVAGAHIFKRVEEPDARLPKATPEASYVTSGEFDSKLDKKDGARLEAAKKIAAIKSITSDIDKKDGKRVFHCPDVAIGTFVWRRGLKNIAGFDFESSDKGRAPARGEARVPADEQIFLMMDEQENNYAWTEPIFLEKFGPNELAGLALMSRNHIDEFENEAERKVQNEHIVALVKAISGWTNCQMIEFGKIPAPDEALLELDKHKELRQLFALGAQMDPKVLAKRKFLKHLAFLELSQMDECDTVLGGLKDSAAIVSITILHCAPSASGLEALATCPNLNVLDMVHCPVDTPALYAIAKIKSLKRLRIDETKLLPEQIPALAKLRHIEHVELLLPKWPADKFQQLRKLLPNATLMDVWRGRRNFPG